MLNLLIAGLLAAAPLPSLSAAPSQGPTSTEVAMPSQPTPLHGTLQTPEGPIEAVAAIIPGSGPTDRNGDSLNGGAGFQVRAGTYRLLAQGLAERGVATLRIDKRGVAASSAAGFDESRLTFDRMIEDAHDWAAEAARRTGQPCAWLIGHSEGALVALGATRRADDRICGLVLLSGAGRPAATVIAEQLAGLPEPLKGQAMTALADLAEGRTTPSVPGLESLFRPSVQPYLISWFALDPAALAAAYDGPVLIGQGTTDLQVGMADADALALAQPLARLVRFEGANHVLKLAPPERVANLAIYGEPNLPLAPGVVEAVADFIRDPGR